MKVARKNDQADVRQGSALGHDEIKARRAVDKLQARRDSELQTWMNFTKMTP